VTCNVLMRDVAQLASVQAERNSLREDLVNYRTSKRHADSSWRAERDKAERLEKELAFYQAQSARAMADRDKACPLPQPPPKAPSSLDCLATWHRVVCKQFHCVSPAAPTRLGCACRLRGRRRSCARAR